MGAHGSSGGETESFLQDRADEADLITQALIEGQLRAARILNVVRVLLTASFFAIYPVAIYAFGMEHLRHTWWLAGLYLALALAVLWWSRCSDRAAGWSRFAVPFLDMPIVTLIQWQNIPAGDHPLTGPSFTLVFFLFLTVMSSFGMRSWQIYLSAAVGVICHGLLTELVGLTLLQHVFAAVVLFLTAWMVSHIPRRATELFREAAERQARRDRLALYFSPGVAELIEERPGIAEGEACEISVLFCDIRGFTSLSEGLEAREVVALLNDYLGHMVDAVFRSGGTLDKYLGDGLLAYFNAPVRQSDHALRAARCALQMVTSLGELNEARGARGEPPLEIGIGVHAGDAVVGNIGAPHRREFTAIGDAVNVASRLQGLTRNEGREIIVSSALVERLPADSGLLVEEIGDVAVRGREQSVRVYGLEMGDADVSER